jgi:hypothetical protein
MSIDTVDTDASELRQAVLDALGRVKSGASEREKVGEASVEAQGAHQFLFFLKPEVTETYESGGFADALDISLEGIAHFGLSIETINVLSGAYLGEHDVIAAHYGVINQLARDAKAHLSHDAREHFTTTYGVQADDANIVGGLEYLDTRPECSQESLEERWTSAAHTKLAGGTYCGVLQEDGQDLYLINGFHPGQLSQFTGKGRTIVVMALRGDTKWAAARSEFIGATNPEEAREGSLRQRFWARRESWRADELSGGRNGVHLSAGPVEGLVELQRFGTDYSLGEARPVTDFVFGKQLAQAFNEPQIAWILSNPDLEYKGHQASIFDHTEEMDGSDAMALLREVTP